jgi:hypothetical protein
LPFAGDGFAITLPGSAHAANISHVRILSISGASIGLRPPEERLLR